MRSSKVVLTFALLSVLAQGAQAGILSVSDAQIIRAGRQAHAQVMTQYGAWHNAQEQARVERLGNNLTRFSARPEIHYRFYLLDSKVLNAFATPDGSIHVTRGLAANFTDDNELSFILGHEITHVERRHGKQMVEKSMQTQLGGNVLLMILGRRSPLTRLGISGAATWLNMKYSREFETQADEGGMRLLKREGIDPENGPKALELLFELSKANPGLLTKYFGTHPLPAERIEHAKAFTQALKADNIKEEKTSP